MGRDLGRRRRTAWRCRAAPAGLQSRGRRRRCGAAATGPPPLGRRRAEPSRCRQVTASEVAVTDPRHRAAEPPSYWGNQFVFLQEWSLQQ